MQYDMISTLNRDI